MNDFIVDLVYCDTCKEYTNQIIVKYHFYLRANFSFDDTHVQKFRCNVCQRTNERTLYFCHTCCNYTSQNIISEEENFLFSEHIDLTLLCKSCGHNNEAIRYTEEYIQRLKNAKDEKGGIYCDYCLSYKKQTLLDKQPSDLNPELDLTTYRCKTCSGTNYGMSEKKDVI